LSKRDFVACVGRAETTRWAGSGVSFECDDDDLEDGDDPTFLEKLGFSKLAECGITAEEFAKRNVLAFNVRFLTTAPSERGRAECSVGGREACCAMLHAGKQAKAVREPEQLFAEGILSQAELDCELGRLHLRPPPS